MNAFTKNLKPRNRYSVYRDSLRNSVNNNSTLAGQPISVQGQGIPVSSNRSSQTKYPTVIQNPINPALQKLSPRSLPKSDRSQYNESSFSNIPIVKPKTKAKKK